MTLFLLPALNNLYIQTCPRALSLPLFLVQKADDKRRIPSAGAARPLSPPHKKEVTRLPFTCLAPPAALVGVVDCGTLGSNGTRQRLRLARERARGLAAHGPRCNDEGVARRVG